MDLNDLRRDRTEAADKMATTADELARLESEEPDNADGIAAAQSEFDAAQATFDKLDAQVKRAEAVEAAQAASATSEADTAPAPAQAQSPDAKGQDAGLMIKALLQAKGDKDKAIARLEDDGHSGISAALSTATEAAGGVTIPRAMSQNLIDLLRPMVVMRNAGAMIHDMPAGQLRNARLLTDPMSTYAAENADIPESEPTFDKVDEAFKKLTSLVPVSNSLLRHNSLSLGTVIRDIMLSSMALREDLAFIRGDGSNDTPIGARNFVLAGNLQSGVGNAVAVVEAALRTMRSNLEDANVQMARPGWIMRASTKNFLADLRDGAGGNKLYPSIDNNGTLHGWPIYTTSQIPDNLGNGANEVEIYLIDFAEMMIGDAMDITVAMSTEAAYVTGGNTASAFQKDQTLFRAISEHDFAPAHDEAIAVTTGIGWGN